MLMPRRLYGGVHLTSTSPDKILYLMDSYYGPMAGTEKQFLELVTHIDRKLFCPSLAVFRQTDYLKTHSFPCSVAVLNIHKLVSLAASIRLAKLSFHVRRCGYKIVHVFFNDASIVAPTFCKLGGAKVIVSRRDMGFWYTPANLAALRISNRFVDCIVPNSHAVKENVHRREGFRNEKMVVIYNGHDQSKFTEPPATRLRESLGIGIDDPIVGMVANLYPIKRQSDLIRAFAIAQRKLGNIHLLFIGEGKEKDELQRLAYSLALERRIHFLGSVPNAIPFIKHITVGVLCSESEGLSNAIIEYMGCGKPIICTRVGGNSEIVEDGYNGFLVNVGDVEGLAAQLIRILSESSLADRMGVRSRLRMQERLTSEEMVKSYVNLYTQVLYGKKEGRRPVKDSELDCLHS